MTKSDSGLIVSVVRSVWFSILMAVSLLAQDGSADLISDQLKVKVEQVLLEEGLTGAAWAYRSRGGDLEFGHAGFRDAEAQLPFELQTKFHVGSVTKAVLATAVLRLVSQGKLGLDAPVTEYIPQLDIDNPWGVTDPVTVRHLLDHSSGFDDARLWHMFSDQIQPDTPLIESFTRQADVLRARARPGSRFSYSNMGYGLLGLLIESVTGESYETYLDREFLKPLGMEDSSFTFTTQEGENADSRLAWGHIDDGSRYAAVPIMLRPAGQFTTTSQDWMKFALFLMSDGEINGRVFIEPELMAARGVATTTLAAKAGLEVGYAMGLSRLDRYGSIGLCHSGNIIGFMALMCIYPQSHQAFTVSVNTDSETANYRRLYDVIASALDHPMQAKPVRATPADDSLDWQGYYILAPNRFESFRYLDLVFGFSRFYWEADDLIFDPFQGATRMLVPVGGYILAATDRQQESHVLMKSEEGIPLISDGYRTYQQISPLMLIFLWSSLSLGMLALLWFFVAGLLEIKRQKLNAFKRPAGIGFLAVIALLVPVPLFFLQPFMALGDFTLASFALATATSLLPICMLISLGLGMRGDSRSRINWLHAIAALAVLQWCAVLFYFGLLPLKLWT